MVGRRKDQRLIHPDRLAELEERAQDGVDLRAALRSLNSKRYRMMERIRLNPDSSAQARGWLEFESDLGDALLQLQRQRGVLPGEDDADA